MTPCGPDVAVGLQIKIGSCVSPSDPGMVCSVIENAPSLQISVSDSLFAFVSRRLSDIESGVSGIGICFETSSSGAINSGSNDGGGPIRMSSTDECVAVSDRSVPAEEEPPFSVLEFMGLAASRISMWRYSRLFQE